jgi:hypothetical protein
MKINHSDDPIRQIAPHQTPNRKTPTKADFGEVLKQTLNSSPATQQTIPPAGSVNPLMPAQIQHLSAADKNAAVDRIEEILDLLEDYRRKLIDPAVTLKDIHPVVAAIENENKNLQAMLDFLADGDELKTILNQTLITTSVEVIKFNKGDYITS